MNMQDIKNCITLEEAGQKLEFRNLACPNWTEKSVWEFITKWNPEVSEYRVKPQPPKLVRTALNLDDFFTLWIANEHGENPTRILSINKTHVIDNVGYTYSYEDLMKVKFTWSTDCVNWKPCWKEVESLWPKI